MSQPEALDVHAPYVQELVEAGDWAALVRYWGPETVSEAFISN